MRDDQSVLTDFLNHGILPFVGRDVVIHRLLQFWRGTIEASGLRTFVVVGEAGIGKSRLVEEVISRIEMQGGSVAHLRLRPSSSGSPVALLSDVLWNSPTIRPLLRAKPGTSLDSVVDALRRLCRLRPLLIVIEDVHLLRGETLSDFAVLLNVLADDPVSLLCATRPVDDRTLDILEASLAEQVDLEGLTEENITSIGTALFGSNGAANAIASLRRATLGNPLAIRGALRAALRQETILRETTGAWKGDERFDEIVRLGAKSITEGLAAHLTPQERSDADALASLGEVFAYEAAEILLGDGATKSIESLLFKGILVRSVTVATPLFKGRKSAFRLLSFTHTLVHHALIAEGSVPVIPLLNLVEKQAPLYSIVPFERLVDAAAEIPINHRLSLIDVVDVALSIAAFLDETSEWTLARQLVDAVAKLVAGDVLSAKERTDLELYLLDVRLRLLERDLHGEEFDQTLKRLFERARALPEEESPPHIICAFSHQYKRAVYAGHGSELCDQIEKEIDLLVAAFPSVVTALGYIRYLGWRTERASLRGDWNIQEQIEGQIEELVCDRNLSEALRTELQAALCTNYLLLVRTPEEYAKRLRRITEADQVYHSSLSEVSWLLQKARFYGFTGHFKRQWEVYSRAQALAEKRGQKDIAASLAESLVKCRLALGFSPDDAEALFIRGGMLTPEGGRDMIVVNNLAAIALLQGEYEWAIRFYDKHFISIEQNPTILPILLDLYRDDPIRMFEENSDHPWIADVRGSILHLLKGSGSEEERGNDVRKVEAFIGENLAVVPIATRHVLQLHGVLRLLTLLSRSSASRWFPNLSELLRMGTMKILDWSAERELWLLMRAHLNNYATVLTVEERALWEEKINLLREANLPFHASRSKIGTIHLSMFGTISLTISGDDSPIVPRGLRLKTLLGVMVANEILDRPLERDEFLAVASGYAEDPRHARDIVNKTVSRLREAFGTPEAIMTDGETPRLNRQVVLIDLVEALDALERAAQALRQGALMRATPAIKTALDLWKGDVLYPTLYDEFFETLREEFEVKVRERLLSVVQGLFSEGDYAGAEELLRRMREIIPEDGEVADLLIRALESDGRKVEAMRVRILAEPVE